MKQGVIDFRVYEDGTEFLGVSKISLPDISFLTQNMSGAGIGGNMEVVLRGIIDSMSMTMDFKQTTDKTIQLAEPRPHNLSLCVAEQVEDMLNAKVSVENVKYVVIATPKTFKIGSIAPASSNDGSGEFAVRYFAMFIGGQRMIEVDPINSICYINGTDYLADVRKALGK